LVDLGEGSEGGILLRDRVVFQPIVVGEAEKVVRRVHGGVHVTQLEGGSNFFLGLFGWLLFLGATGCHCA